MITRRMAVLALLASPLGYYKALAGQAPKGSAPGVARLSIDLDQWAGIEVKKGTRTTFISAAEIWAALATKE